MEIKNYFDVLVLLEKSKDLNIEDISNILNFDLEDVENLIKFLKDNDYIDVNFNVTETGYVFLDNYKVDNAIIMAAGMSSRFAPLSYEKPKSLLEVKGEVLIERQINQLREVGIENITIVVGYMKDKMMYLADKFNVNIVENDDYYRYNNTSSLKLVTDKLSNTYICSSDNYFLINPFEKYVYNSYYSCVFEDGYTDEYCVSFDENGIIKSVKIGGNSSWIMLGHVYFNRDFSSKFVNILNREFENDITKQQLWEDLYIRYIDELEMNIRKYDNNFIKEFDSLEELRLFDSSYINNTGSFIFKNIIKVFDCEEKDIKNILPLKGGITNISFKFECNGEKYVYRHPGVGTEGYINRKSEYESMQIAKKLELDNTYIYMDPEKGWKISKYIENSKTLDYSDEKNVNLALEKLRILHNSNYETNYYFDVWNEIEKFKKDIVGYENSDLKDISYLYDLIEILKEYLINDSFPKTICHADSYAPNFLISENGSMSLIDWEYSGMSDPACDIGTFIACANYNLDESEEIIRKYFGRNITLQELRHYFGYVSVMAFYWFLWAIYQEINGNNVGEYLYIWYKYAKLYGEKAKELYNF